MAVEVATQQLVGSYRLTSLLGQGGFANIYLGEHMYLNTKAAVKVLNTWLAGENEIERFHTEALMSANLRHEHIVRVLDFGLEEDLPFLVLEYAPNGTLRQYFPSGEPLPLTTILPIIMQAASALQYIHNQGLIHCDVKPDNLLLGPNNEVWVSDFGIAQYTQCAENQQRKELRGTFAYTAPEQLCGKPLPASDQYALAVMVYEWLCGQRPFQGTMLSIWSQHLYSQPLSLRDRMPGISSAVEQVVFKALAKDPAQRFTHVLDFATALEQASMVEERVVHSYSLSSIWSKLQRCRKPEFRSLKMPTFETIQCTHSTEMLLTV